MLGLRLYIGTLDLLLFIGLLSTRHVGPLEGIVIVCPMLFLILDMTNELAELRQLEARVLRLSRCTMQIK